MYAAFTNAIARDREHEIRVAAQRAASGGLATGEAADATRPARSPVGLVAIRPARPADSVTLERLGRLDGDGALAAALVAHAEAGRVLVGEVGDEIVAAIALADGHVAADPFRPSAAVAELLRLRAEQLAAPAEHRHRWAGILRPRVS